jgi:hypothetical protein
MHFQWVDSVETVVDWDGHLWTLQLPLQRHRPSHDMAIHLREPITNSKSSVIRVNYATKYGVNLQHDAPKRVDIAFHVAAWGGLGRACRASCCYINLWRTVSYSATEPRRTQRGALDII